jgi:hypothetical protein
MNKTGRKAPRPQRYYVPDLGLEVKVERINEKRYCVHLPTGMERVALHEMKGWENRGEWTEVSDERD